MATDRLEEDSVDLVYYFKIILKHKIIILVGTFLCLLVGAWLRWTQPVVSVYEAKASVMVLPPKLRSELLPNFPIGLYDALSKTQDIKQDIISTLNLRDGQGQPITISHLDGILETKVVSQQEGAPVLLDFYVTSTDTQSLSPVAIVNTWAAVFVKKNQGLTSQEATGSYEYITGQYHTIKANLDSVNQILADLNSKRTLETLQAEFNIKKERLTGLQNEQIANTFKLQDTKALIENYEKQIRASETVNGTWIGNLEFAHQFLEVPSGLDQIQIDFRNDIIRARDEYAKIKEEIRQFNLKEDLVFKQQVLASKRDVFATHLKELHQINVDVGATAETLESIKISEGGPSRVDFTTPDNWREWASLQVGHNIFESRKAQLSQEIIYLKTEIDSLAIALAEKQSILDGLNEALELHSHHYMLYKPQYLSIQKSLRELQKTLRETQERLQTIRQHKDSLHKAVDALALRISKLDIQKNTLEREVNLYQAMFDKFAQLQEDARISKARQPEDVKVVATAVAPERISSGTQPLSLVFIAGIGFIISLFLAFVIEYFHKAKLQLQTK